MRPDYSCWNPGGDDERNPPCLGAFVIGALTVLTIVFAAILIIL